jgi:UDP-N-acetylglucosamine acyltransferase
MIHPTAKIDPQVELGDGVEVEEYAVIRGKVCIGAGTVVRPYTMICGTTRIGARCRIGPCAFIGMDPQHRGYTGAETSLVVGDDNVIREQSTLHRAFQSGEGHATVLGSNCYLMAGSHVGHDSRVGDNVTIGNNSLLAGHVTVGDGTFLGGACGIHQFCRVGRLAIMGGGEILRKDLLPFAAMRLGGMKGYNAIGCKRSEMSREAIHALRAAFHRIHSRRSVLEAVKELEEEGIAVPQVREMVEFVKNSKRGIVPSTRFLAVYRAADDEE